MKLSKGTSRGLPEPLWRAEVRDMIIFEGEQYAWLHIPAERLTLIRADITPDEMDDAKRNWREEALPAAGLG